MRLKRLVARGFKSFADRTEFEFDARLTGIIGPNGCGKSNVVDAIKWVLGDQRAKSLRGTEMTDVIFKGAEGREAMGMAEVTITFEDPEGRVDGRTEVDISRRLTLEKESSYLLNGQEVRLKDVRDVLLDTGLGTGGYSVMEQGRIDAVLSANPEARRAIFEEAAGIARFKLQKKEALRKLERTDQNLARATDLIEERARRIRSLRIQAGKARRWSELQAALRDLRVALAVLDGGELRRQRAAAQQRLQQDQQAQADLEGRRDAAAARVRAGDEEIARCGRALEEVRAELAGCQAELTAHRERALAQRQRAAELQEEAERGRLREQGLAEQRREREATRQASRDRLAAQEQELVLLQKAIEAGQHELRNAQQALRAQQAEREQVRERLLELVHARARARNRAADQEAQLAAARARRLRLDERVSVLGGESAALAAERERWTAELGELRTRERILQEREAQGLADLRAADAAAAALAGEESQLRNELSEVDGRRQALVAMEAHMEGLDQAPRHVLQHAPPGLRGRLVDLLEVDLAHSRALEAALGQYVQALVVDSRATAEAVVRDLQARQLGRVLLLIEDEFGAEPAWPALLPLPPGARYLIDLVRPAGASAGSQRLLAWLLRGVALVPDLGLADATRADLCFVTEDGSLLCGPRVEGGAAAEGRAGLVVRRSQIAELGQAAAALEQRLARLLDGKERAGSRVEQLKLEVRQLGEALQQVRRAAHEADGQLGRAAARAADVHKEQDELALEAADLRAASARARAVLGSALFDQHLLRRQETRLQETEAAASDRIGRAQAAVEARARAEQELRLQQAQGAEAREGLLRTIRMHDDALRELDASAQELAGRIAENAAGSERAAAEHDRLLALAAEVEQRSAGLARQRDERETGLQAARTGQRQQQEELERIEEQRRQGGDALAQQRLELAEIEHRFQRLEERLREETEVELLRCLGEVHGLGLCDDPAWQGPPAPAGAVEELEGPPLPPETLAAWAGLSRLWTDPAFDPAAARKEVQVLQSQKDRLGAVNLDAVQELEQEEGQFTTLEQEVGDLKEARRALLETLRRLETESKTLFETTFVEARRNFQEIFRKLFQGGKADMFLADTEDVLEAGIEIVAQPPGKQLQSINLLSGGERSLTAVAILFALFKVRPSPFCILDEVDAALDETNVERFLRVLHDFVGSTQFCIVTHHKRTMAECQVLYGITMQRRGVSSRIAVALHEVDGFQQGAAAERTAVGAAPDPARRQRIAGEEPVGF